MYPKYNASMNAVEFFSGIGAFAYAAHTEGVNVVAAFDQGQDANRVYQHNFNVSPSARNLDTLPAGVVPDADLWWMSPPCTPYTVRGAQRDEQDPRAKSLLHLLDVLSDKLPTTIIVENVVAFATSRMFARLSDSLNQLDYHTRIVELCSSQFGIPMKRPRFFVVASRNPLPEIGLPSARERIPLALFLDAGNANGCLNIHPSTVARYEEGMNIIEPNDNDAYAICFTSGYGVSFKSSGSFIRQNGTVRRFAPEEILALLGFGPEFSFPPDMDLKSRWRLAGNSVDIRCIQHLLRVL